jgi:hypothetical protein
MVRKVAVESMSLSSRRRKITVYEVSEEDESFYRGVREILAELPATDDIIILTLKGHLIIEQLLIRMMECAAVNPAPLKDLNRLQFSTRVALAESLSPPFERRDGDIWSLARKVGKIRNDIAHQLRPKKLHEDVQSFLDLYIRFFGARVAPAIRHVDREDVTKDNHLIPRNVRRGTVAEKYRNALAGTSQGLAAVLAVIRDNSKISHNALRKDLEKSTNGRIGRKKKEP